MNRQSGSLAPIPVTPKTSNPSQHTLLQFPSAPSNVKGKSREGRRSWLSFPSRPRNLPIWRPSTDRGQSPPTPQWPLPSQPISQQPQQQEKQQQEQQQSQKHHETPHYEPNPALARPYTHPRDAPLPPRPASASSTSLSSSTTPILTDDPGLSPRTRGPPSDMLLPHPLSPRFPIASSPPRPSDAPPLPPASHQRNGSFQTRYMNMAMSTQRIPRAHNVLANLFAWMMLLAFMVAPPNFRGAASTATTGGPIPSVPLLAASCAVFGLGALGMLWLALTWRRNYIWLMNRVYLPLMLNSLAGLVASLVVVDVRDAMWFSVAAYVSVAIEGATLLLTGALFFYTNYLLLGRVKREHARETSTKNVVDLVKAGERPSFAPGSIV